MNHIILTSHINLAQGMYDSLKFFNSDIDNVEYICAYENEEDFEGILRTAIRVAGEKNVIIVTDMLTGSITQTALKLTREFPIHVISGMSLAMLLAIIYEENNIGPEEIENIIRAGRESICYVNEIKVDDVADNL
jgi:mannose/fructose-specific phosphotransferase system component IIA